MRTSKVLHIADVCLDEVPAIMSGDLQCGHCRAELGIYLHGHTKGYRHPRVNENWVAPSHPNHRYRVVYPLLIQRKTILLMNLLCPSCNARGNFTDLEGGMLNLDGLKKSFQETCVECDKPLLDATSHLLRFNGKHYCFECLSGF